MNPNGTANHKQFGSGDKIRVRKMTIKQKIMVVRLLVCRACGYEWLPKKSLNGRMPKWCANQKCKSVYWNIIPRKELRKNEANARSAGRNPSNGIDTNKNQSPPPTGDVSEMVQPH